MGNLHRIQWIDQRIRAGQHPNCTAIAAQFEISGRQAARDIEYLRDSLGAPIAYSAKHNGYVYKGTEFRLPQLALSVEDKDTLRALSVQYARAESQNARRLADLFEKLSRGGDGYPGHDTGRHELHGSPAHTGPAEPSVPLTPPVPTHPVTMPPATTPPATTPLALTPATLPPADGDDPVLLMYHQLDLAYQLRRKVNLTYVDARHRATTRVVHPYLLFTRGQTPYLVAHCELRRQVRIFSLKRVTQVDTLRAGYTIADTFRPGDYQRLSAAPKRQHYTAAVHMDGKTVEIPFQRSSEFLSWLLALPPGFRLLGPDWLRERLIGRLNALLADHPPP